MELESFSTDIGPWGGLIRIESVECGGKGDIIWWFFDFVRFIEEATWARSLHRLMLLCVNITRGVHRETDNAQLHLIFGNIFVVQAREKTLDITSANCASWHHYYMGSISIWVAAVSEAEAIPSGQIVCRVHIERLWDVTKDYFSSWPIHVYRPTDTRFMILCWPSCGTHSFNRNDMDTIDWI